MQSRERIDMFIDENKALIRRMFGEYSSPDDDGVHRDHYETYDGKTIHTRTERSRSSFAGASSNKYDVLFVTSFVFYHAGSDILPVEIY